jgi:hypothetical protein
MDEAVEGGRGRWSTAVALTIAVLVLSVGDALALVVLPLAILLVALPSERRMWWILVGVLLTLLALLLSGGTLAVLSQGWALVLGAMFLTSTIFKPAWSVISRGLASTAAALATGALALFASGQVGELDSLVRSHLTAISALTMGDLQARMPNAAWIPEFTAATAQIAQLQADLFPALLALQSLAALALASWWVRRLGRSDSDVFRLSRLRDFRFNDQLIWVLIAGIILLLATNYPGVDRVGHNVLLFMGALYALRGLAVFVFLATGSKSVATMILGALAFVFLYPVALTAALLMGVGDTWLDVRRRVATAAQP